MQKYLSQALALVQKLWAQEPARVISVVAAVVVFVAAKLGIVVPVQSVTTALALVVPVLLSGALIRTQVTPVARAVLAAAEKAVTPPAPKV